MLIEELIKTCSDPHVARAAVLSLGAGFFTRIENLAAEQGVSAGEFVSETVQHFRLRANEADWAELGRATAGRDIPILCGLRHILEKSLRDEMPDVVLPGAPMAESFASMAFCCGLA